VHAVLVRAVVWKPLIGVAEENFFDDGNFLIARSVVGEPVIPGTYWAALAACDI
jgi:hypothetical protein